MKTFQTTHRVNHSADEMFALVADIERYPEFVPLCKALRIRTRDTSKEDGDEILIADMTVAYKLFSETFTSRVTLNRENRTIRVEYLDGPFNHLDNRWTFTDTGEHESEIDFFIAYELKSMSLQLLLGGMFDQAFGKFSEAFEKRADTVYGIDSHTSSPA